MISSMTGFGRAKAERNNVQVTVEMKSVNHRFLEMNIRLPKQLAALEDQVRKIVAAHVRRGRIELTVTIEGDGAATRKLRVDWSLLAEYKRVMDEAGNKFQLQNSLTAADMLALPEIAVIEESAVSHELFAAAVVEAAEQAAQMLRSMRDTEGARLYEDVRQRMEDIEKHVQAIVPYAPLVVQKYRERLQGRVQELGISLDEQRLLAEVVLFAERCDIHEELVRLGSHVAQMRETLESREPVGRKLDFIVQEMHREMNTIGSKANDVMITKHVVEMKNHLEKIREQVQNIE